MRHLAMALSGLVLAVTMTIVWMEPSMIDYKPLAGLGLIVAAILVGIPAGKADADT